MSIRYRFFRKHSLKKMLVDSIVIIFACVLVFEILPANTTFFKLASSHTTFLQKLIHALLALACILLSRSLLMVYKQPWNQTKVINYIYLIVADAMAGILFYCVAEFVLRSVYPFLLEFSLFAMIDIMTLFYRLLYRGLYDEYSMTEQ